MTQLDLPKTCNVVLFGAPGAGKSSIVNMLSGNESPAPISSGVHGCTLESQSYEVDVLGQPVTLWDTVGLEEGEGVGVPWDDAACELYKLLRNLENGVNLLVLVMRGPRIRSSTPANWKLFRDIICLGKVPTALVVTGLEEEENMDKWWWDYKGIFEEYNIFPSAVACVTASRGRLKGGGHVYDPEYKASLGKIQRLIRSTVLVKPLRLQPLEWYETIIETVFETGWCRRPKEVKQPVTRPKNVFRNLEELPEFSSTLVSRLEEKMKQVDG